MYVQCNTEMICVTVTKDKQYYILLISNFRYGLNVVYFLLGNSLLGNCPEESILQSITYCVCL